MRFSVILLLLCLGLSFNVWGQGIGDFSNRIKNLGNISGRGGQSGGSKDSAALGFEHRDDSKDSLSLTFKVLDSSRIARLDSNINDFDKYFLVPSDYLYLGNNGAAATPIVFNPNVKAGFSVGINAFDVYRYKLEETKFYKTNRPYSIFSYQLAGGKEQMIKAFHTQSPNPRINFGFDYNVISAPGFFPSQSANHTSFRAFGNYQSKKKRYNMQVVLINNKIRNNENGGIVADSFLFDPNRRQRFAVPVNLGNKANRNPNPFNTKVNTGSINKDATFFLRQSYDLGKKDSIIINDSTTEYLFYSKLRLQHTFTFQNMSYEYVDFYSDSTYYKNNYSLTLKLGDTVNYREKWSVLKNNISLIQFPDTKNSTQFIAAGVSFENIIRNDNFSKNKYFNIIGHFEYRNRTRNRLWTLQTNGDLWLGGLNAGDFNAYASISRYISPQVGQVNVFFQNVNRSPSFIFDSLSVFNLGTQTASKKENITYLGASIQTKWADLSIKNTLMTNLAYWESFTKAATYSKAINLLQISANRTTKLSKRWNLYSQVTLQQTDNASPIRVPLLFTRNRLAFEGVFYKNLNLSTGLEMRYFTPFKMNAYSSIGSQFVRQDTSTVRNLPDIAAYMHFRIKSFTTYLRFENLNTVSLKNGFGFINNNYATPNHPTQGLIFRLGIYWGFVN